MTQYLTGRPFSNPTSSGKISDEEYFVRVGALKHCEACNKNVAINHKCPKAPK
jgi:hypothetical protein